MYSIYNSYFILSFNVLSVLRSICQSGGGLSSWDKMAERGCSQLGRLNAILSRDQYGGRGSIMGLIELVRLHHTLQLVTLFEFGEVGGCEEYWSQGVSKGVKC
jgi:hypothetical protein